MDRPLKQQRPIGPFAQMGSSGQAHLGLIVDYGREIPMDRQEDAADALAFHLGANDLEVAEIQVGPENANDSIMVILKANSFRLDDVDSAASASVAEMGDMGINVLSDPEVEVILDQR